MRYPPVVSQPVRTSSQSHVPSSHHADKERHITATDTSTASPELAAAADATEAQADAADQEADDEAGAARQAADVGQEEEHMLSLADERGLSSCQEAAADETADPAASEGDADTDHAQEPYYRAQEHCYRVQGLRPIPVARALAGPTVHILLEGYVSLPSTPSLSD